MERKFQVRLPTHNFESDHCHTDFKTLLKILFLRKNLCPFKHFDTFNVNINSVYVLLEMIIKPGWSDAHCIGIFIVLFKIFHPYQSSASCCFLLFIQIYP